MEKLTLKQADRILTINDKLRDYVIKLGASPERVQVLRAGVYLEKFNPAINGEIVKNKYKIKKRDMVLFFMGWLYNFSGLKEVALEMAKINEKEPNIKLLIVGDGDAFNDLKKVREEYNLDNQIILTGKQPYEKIPEFISAADYDNVYIPPEPLNGLDVCYYSKAVLTGSGTFAREAACMGTPAVSFFPGKQLLAVDQKMVNDGWMFHSRDPEEIVDYALNSKRRVVNLDRSKRVQKEVFGIVKNILDDIEKERGKLFYENSDSHRHKT